MPGPQPLTHASVLAAADLLAPHIHHPPLLSSETLSTLASTPTLPITLRLKPENLQKTGAFKIRGATHALLHLTPAQLQRGITTHSSGNHAAALAHAAATLSRHRGTPIPAKIVMPAISSPGKIAATRAYGADIVFSGSTHPERQAAVDEIVRTHNMTFVPPYDDNNVILGQATVALEILREWPECEVIIAPCGGGGLLAGSCLAAAESPALVFGAEPCVGGTDDCARGMREGRRVETVQEGWRTVADGLRTPVGVRNWGVISERCEGVVAVAEERIREAMRLLLERCKLVVEPSAVVGVAAVLEEAGELRRWLRERFPGRGPDDPVRVCCILSGGNVTVEKIAEVFGLDAGKT